MSWWLIPLLVKRYYPLLFASIYSCFLLCPSLVVFISQSPMKISGLKISTQILWPSSGECSCDLILFTANGCIPTYATGWEGCICGVFFWKSRTHQNHKNLWSFWSQPIPISRGAKPPLANEVWGIFIWNPKNKDLEKGAACFSNCDWVFVFFLLSFLMGLETFDCEHSVAPVWTTSSFWWWWV